MNMLIRSKRHENISLTPKHEIRNETRKDILNNYIRVSTEFTKQK